MNGIHDMGGMQDMGPIKYEKNEPVFHAAWEGSGVRHVPGRGCLAQVEPGRVPAHQRSPSPGRLFADELLRAMVIRIA